MKKNQIVAQPDGYYYHGRHFRTLQAARAYKSERDFIEYEKDQTDPWRHTKPVIFVAVMIFIAACMAVYLTA